MRQFNSNFNRSRCRRRGVKCASAVIASIGVAAQTGASFAGDTVSIVLEGEVEPECRLSGLASIVDLGQITKIGSRAVNFGIHCNAPFSFTLQSQEGGLRNTGHTLVRAGFTDRIPYLVRLDIPTDHGAVLNICESTLLTGSGNCATGVSGSGIAIEQVGTLTFSWSIVQEPVAGIFADVFMFSVQTIY